MKENPPLPLVICPFSEYAQQLWSLPWSLTHLTPVSYIQMVCVLLAVGYWGPGTDGPSSYVHVARTGLSH